ncbi:MAG: PepSY domain-containing protein [Rhodospirillales bacterium]|nr:PepSY domain-containing protein [Rhodospirillales bacterium]
MRRRKFLTGFLAIIATGLAVAPPIALADHERKRNGRNGRGRRDNRRRNEPRPKSFYEEGPVGRSSGQDRARRALREGRVLPLGEIMSRVRRNFPGKVLDADLVRDGRRFVYYLKVLDPQGRVAEITVDGQSGRILGVKGRGR